MSANLLSLSRKFKYLVAACIRRLKILSFNKHVQENKAQFLYNYLPDVDFEVFELLEEQEGLVLDVGANRGHCAISVLSNTNALQVFAFEPNSDMAKPLQYIKNRYPERFRYAISGLGAVCENCILRIPVGSHVDVSTNASIRSSEFDKDYVQERLETETGITFKRMKFRSQKVKIQTLDSLNLNPLAIKIDVEGFESRVIEGGLDTIMLHKPMLIIEMNNQHEFVPLLEKLGYRFYKYEPNEKLLIEFSTDETYLNVICVHDERMLFSPEIVRNY